eukprot:4780559-Prymnesium_polylepis.1
MRAGGRQTALPRVRLPIGLRNVEKADRCTVNSSQMAVSSLPGGVHSKTPRQSIGPRWPDRYAHRSLMYPPSGRGHVAADPRAATHP